MVKKVILYLSGPGAVCLIGVALFIHLFTPMNARTWIIAGLIIFFIVFLPLYAVEHFRQSDRKMKERNPDIQFSEKHKRVDWEGGNIHGKIPKFQERKDFIKGKGR